MVRSALLLALTSVAAGQVYAAAPATFDGMHVGVALAYARLSSVQNVSTLDPAGSLVDPAPDGGGPALNQAVLFPSRLSKHRNVELASLSIGRDWQTDHQVWGLEVDVSSGGSAGHAMHSATFSDPVKMPPDYLSNNAGSTSLNWLSTLRGRAGWVQNDVLWYATAGLAAGRVKTESSFQITNIGNPPADFLSGSSRAVRTGFALGLGAEMAVDTHARLKLEVLHHDLGKINYDTTPDLFTAGDIPGVKQHLNSRVSGDQLRVGMNWIF